MGEEKEVRKKWADRHPGCFLFLVLVALPGLLLCSVGAYWYLTIPARIADRLHAQGLPANGEELERWHRPAQDGTQALAEALKELKPLLEKNDNGKLIFNEIPDLLEKEKQIAEFVRELAPVRAAVEKAADSGFLSLGASYRTMRYDLTLDGELPELYRLSMTLSARFDLEVRHTPEPALSALASLYRCSRRMHRYTFWEREAMRVDPENAPFAKLLQTPGLSTASLREFSRLVFSLERPELRREALTDLLAGSLAFLQTFASAIRAKDPAVSDTTRRLPISYPLFSYADQQLATAYMERVYHLMNLPYRDCYDGLDQMPSVGHLPQVCRDLLYFYSDIAADNEFFFRLIHEHYTETTRWLEIGIACALAADRLEGKPWPGEEGKAVPLTAFPADPFTGQPFQLVRSKDALWILSPGPDQIVTTPVSAFSGDQDPARGDDQIFRLPVALYEPPTAPAPSHPSTPTE